MGVCVGGGGRPRKVVGQVSSGGPRGREGWGAAPLPGDAARLVSFGTAPRVAAAAAFERTLTDDPDLQRSIGEVVADYF